MQLRAKRLACKCTALQIEIAAGISRRQWNVSAYYCVSSVATAYTSRLLIVWKARVIWAQNIRPQRKQHRSQSLQMHLQLILVRPNTNRNNLELEWEEVHKPSKLTSTKPSKRTPNCLLIGKWKFIGAVRRLLVTNRVGTSFMSPNPLFILFAIKSASGLICPSGEASYKPNHAKRGNYAKMPFDCHNTQSPNWNLSFQLVNVKINNNNAIANLCMMQTVVAEKVLSAECKCGNQPNRLVHLLNASNHTKMQKR